MFRRKKAKLQAGRTIPAPLEQVESESERMQERKKTHRRRKTSLVLVLLVLAILGLSGYLVLKEFVEEHDIMSFMREEKPEYAIKAKIVDEGGSGQISSRIKEYVALLEQDLADLGLVMTQATLPISARRELYIDLEGKPGYFKVNIDRGTAVTAEDMQRMLTYFDKNGVTEVEYVDVRVEGKGYYK